MENSNGVSSMTNMSHTGKEILPPVNPFSCFPPSHVRSSSFGSGSMSNPMEGWSHHQRCSSESFLIEEQPAWLDDLLDDSEPVCPKFHRRSASDTSAYLDKIYNNVLDGSLWSSQTNGNPVDPNQAANPRSFGGIPNKTPESSLKPVDSIEGFSAANKGIIQQTSGSRCSWEDRDEKHNQPESSGGKSDPQSNPKADAKRAKNSSRQSAHRSRVRKLQYIAELERNAQVLQAEGSGFVAEIEFMDQHNFILTMENRALRQRVDSLSQELLIKHMEHEMLEREIGRLQTLFQMQMHQQQQLHHKHQHPKNRQPKIKDHDSQIQIA